MSDLPILFNGPMVRAIIEGRKTMTRRVVKWPEWLLDHDRGAYWLNHNGGAAYLEDGRMVRTFCNPYPVGRRLWVRETWWANQDGDVAYRADGEMPEHMAGTHWRPSIYMPRWASRITLEVTASRVERLQAITEEDAIAEGMTKRGHWWDAGPNWKGDGAGESALEAFAITWDTIDAKHGHSWEANDYVFAVTFRRIEP